MSLFEPSIAHGERIEALEREVDHLTELVRNILKTVAQHEVAMAALYPSEGGVKK
jgi:tyrosine-protein phosphatase YwqE